MTGMTDVRYWLWLTLKKEITGPVITLLLSHFKTPQKIYDAKDFSHIPELRPAERKALLDKNMARVGKVSDICRKKGIKVLAFDNPCYPKLLAKIYDPPYVLYARFREKIDLNFHVPLAVVGTRHATPYGKDVAFSLAKELAQKGVTIISGMAAGIDSAAASGALSGGGKTVAILGCGVDRCYPAYNRKLMEKIIDSGMVLSEFPPGTPPYRQNFPTRNRIISGLSLGALVVEAPERSGSLITANMAAEHNREVFSVPGDITRSTFKGSNRLIQDGAKPVLCAEDVLCEFPDHYHEFLNENAKEMPSTEILRESSAMVFSDSEKKVIRHLSEDPVSVDYLAEQGIQAAELMAALTTLELKGAVKVLPGKQYQLINK